MFNYNFYFNYALSVAFKEDLSMKAYQIHLTHHEEKYSLEHTIWMNSE